MYAAVKAGREGLLISNDEMRDHIFQLLAPKFFYKWKQARPDAPVPATAKCRPLPRRIPGLQHRYDTPRVKNTVSSRRRALSYLCPRCKNAAVSRRDPLDPRLVVPS